MPTPVTGPVDISLPANKVVWASFVVQSWADQKATITLPDSSTVVLSGNNTRGADPPIAFRDHKVFQVPANSGESTVLLQNGSGSQLADSKVIWGNQSLVYDGNIYSQTYTFASEDSTDNDYNDSFLTITWFEDEG